MKFFIFTVLLFTASCSSASSNRTPNSAFDKGSRVSFENSTNFLERLLVSKAGLNKMVQNIFEEFKEQGFEPYRESSVQAKDRGDGLNVLPLPVSKKGSWYNLRVDFTFTDDLGLAAKYRLKIRFQGRERDRGVDPHPTSVEYSLIDLLPVLPVPGVSMGN